MEKYYFFLKDALTSKQRSEVDPLHQMMPLTYRRPPYRLASTRKAIKKASTEWKMHQKELISMGRLDEVSSLYKKTP